MADKNAETNGAVPAQEEKFVLTAEQAAVGQQLFAASQQINPTHTTERTMPWEE